jgi:hypothetical protein
VYERTNRDEHRPAQKRETSRRLLRPRLGRRKILTTARRDLDLDAPEDDDGESEKEELSA